jgi:hypothetical protein
MELLENPGLLDYKVTNPALITKTSILIRISYFHILNYSDRLRAYPITGISNAAISCP